MNSVTNNILFYIRHVYNAWLFSRNCAVYFRTEDDIYYIDTHLAYKNVFRFCSTTRPLTLVDSNFERGLFRLAAYASYKEANRIPSQEDWEKFVNDAYRYSYTL
jgi:hypothetical protein